MQARLHTDDSDRDAALTGSDWFDTKTYPTWTFQSTKITPAPGGFTMTGMLTIHGVSRSETIDGFRRSGQSKHPHYHATCQIDRHAFGMHVVPLDPAIGNPGRCHARYRDGSTVDCSLPCGLRGVYEPLVVRG